MRMSIWLVLALAVAGCSGDSPGASRACSGDLYDGCFDEHNCTSGNCHNFTALGFQACSMSCTPGDNAACMATTDGKPATCGSDGICTPPARNPCTPAP